VQARRIRPQTGSIDRRRLAAAGLSAVLPGLGQLFNRRPTLAAIFLLPTMVVILVALLLWVTQSPTQLAARAMAPAILSALLTLNLILLVWRLLAVGQGFLDTRWHGPTSRVGVIGILVIAALVAIPHALAYQYGTAFRDFARVFDPATGTPGGTPIPEPLPEERVTVLLVGVDRSPTRTTNLTDTMIVASLDPVGGTVSMVSVPRDLIGTPLGNGDTFAPKLNSLVDYADRHPDEFPDGGMAALRSAIGALLDIEIDYEARIDLEGFRAMVDAVGGIDVTVTQAIDDPEYDGVGFSIEPGQHHLDGATALAYVRSRKGLGDSDFTRAIRQQQVLVALRDAVTKDGSLVWELPALLQAVGDAIETDVPREHLPQLAAIVDRVQGTDVVRALVRHPLVRTVDSRYGSSLQPDLEAIREMSAKLFPEPGEEPQPWPTPKPTAKTKATAAP
jgi:LCP family protein required for cell wall assembly